MIVVTVTYPASETSRFDLDYYRNAHLPLVCARWAAFGLQRARFLRGTAVPGGGPLATHLTALLYFASEQDFQRAVEQHGREIMGDIKNFTDVRPTVQLNEEFE
ncbi:MAG TPA: EthD family reductase [Acetobacteraceae bacterium]|nr:EthD family reductase [Acetobacteraceae bacterium]